MVLPQPSHTFVFLFILHNNGDTGDTGFNGNYTNGSAGSSGGLAGYYLYERNPTGPYSNLVHFINQGTLGGRTTVSTTGLTVPSGF